MVLLYSQLGIWESDTVTIGLDDWLYACPDEMAMICGKDVRVLCLCLLLLLRCI